MLSAQWEAEIQKPVFSEKSPLFVRSTRTKVNLGINVGSHENDTFSIHRHAPGLAVYRFERLDALHYELSDRRRPHPGDARYRGAYSVHEYNRRVRDALAHQIERKLHEADASAIRIYIDILGGSHTGLS